MTEVDIAAALHHYIDECGWDWPITAKVVNRLCIKDRTAKELKQIYFEQQSKHSHEGFAK